MTVMKQKATAFKQLAWQIPSLLMLSFLIAVGTNQLRTDGISLVGNWSVEARFSDAAGDSMVISLEQAKQLFKKDEALFLDARPESQYAEGHIKGALNCPWHAVDRYFMELADRLDGKKTVITYCDGESCDLSHELALFLKETGFKNVHVLVNGWTVWQQAGLPVDVGK
jgi:rhodanese-related sulfurtransferase